MAWNPRLLTELAVMCETGAIFVTNVTSAVRGSRNNLTSRKLRPADPDTHNQIGRIRGLEWANHPRLLLFGEGDHL